MARVLVPLANGCEEMEAITIIDVLRRGGIDVVSAGLEAGPVTGSRRSVLVPDTTLDAVLEDEFDMVVLPGGLPGADHLDRDPRIITLLQSMHRKGRYTAAICAAPKVLATAGLLDGRAATSYPGVLDKIHVPGLRFTAEHVVKDDRVITSQGPGTAMDFALALIDVLVGRDVRSRVEAGLRPGR
ncbi:MAG: DJ-1/PfpI family protein [Gammaproteobacteria bacterium]|nr:DJ-1/PfpI family protein [Gammaproteobacteria bacterium]MCP5136141.1 DJ-1/PfpI family protein [Gammaproteobacteria bacterium]